jgi:hypothetical protein
MLDLISTGVRAPAIPAAPRPRLAPVPDAAPAALTPTAHAAPPKLTPTAQVTPTGAAALERAATAKLTPTPQAAPPAAAPATATATDRFTPRPKLISEAPGDPRRPAGPRPRLTPVPGSAPIDPDATLIGQPMPPRTPVPWPRPSGTPQVGTPIPARNLRDAYPNLYRPAPSPSRPQANPFDDRPASSVNFGSAFDMSHVVRRDTVMRRVALAVAIAIALLAVLLIARQF